MQKLFEPVYAPTTYTYQVCQSPSRRTVTYLSVLEELVGYSRKGIIDVLNLIVTDFVHLQIRRNAVHAIYNICTR